MKQSALPLVCLGALLAGGGEMEAQQLAGFAMAPSSWMQPDLTGSPPPGQHPQDPADELYRAARAALNQNDYRRAAQLFRRLVEQHPRSAYAADALYWEAFAHYRTGRPEGMRTALNRLELQRRNYPRAATRTDGDALATRIRGELARQGDATAAERVSRDAGRAAQRTTCDGDDEVRTAALNALFQMNSEQAVPALRQVLARRDECAAPLRERAVFLLSQKPTAETETILLEVARNDPSSKVREMAVFWLSRVPGDRALGVLEQIIRGQGDIAVREHAVFALSQHRNPRAAELVRGFTLDTSLPQAVREKAIFWTGQSRSAENAAFLRSLYGRLETPQLKENAIFALSQMKGLGNERWLLDLAMNEAEPLEARKKALFWAGQGGVPVQDLTGVYDRSRDAQMREQVIFVLSQRREPAALDKLVEIARHERDAELRKKAIFWLGQSKDPRAAQVLMEIAG